MDSGDQNGPSAPAEPPLLNRRARLVSAAVPEPTDEPPAQSTKRSRRSKPVDPIADASAAAPPEDATDAMTPRLRRGKPRRNPPPTGADETEHDPLVPRSAEVDASTTALLYDPQNPEAVRMALEQLDFGAGDYRVVYDPITDVVPLWVHRWNALRLYSTSEAVAGWISDTQRRPPGGDANVSLPSSWGRTAHATAIDGAIQRLRLDLRDAEQLRLEVQLGVDGGTWGAGHRTVETDHPLPGDPFWMTRGAAERCVTELVVYLQDCIQRLTELVVAFGDAAAPGGAEVGAQAHQFCSAAEKAQAAVVERVALETVADSNAMWLRRDHQPSHAADAGKQRRHRSAAAALTPQQASITRIRDTASRVYDAPIVLDQFVVPPESTVMDPLAIKDADMLTAPQVALAERDSLRRAYTIHISFLRFRDRVDLTAEQQYASYILDAYEQYQLLVSNLKPDLKSRQFYRQLLQTLETQQRAQQLPGGQASAGAQQLQHLQQQHIAVLRELYQRSADAERACLTQLIVCWRQLTQLREAQQSRDVKLSLAFRRHGVDGGVAASDGADDVLNYVPVLTDADVPSASSPTSPPQQQPHSQVVAGRSLPLSQTSKRYKIVVYARTSKTVPPQLVGATEPRPLNSTCTAHVNETFELRTTHDPTELVLNVVCDDNGEVLAVTRIPASTTHAAMLLPFNTGSYFTSPVNGESKEVCGVISVATTWTTSEGMSMDAVERMFLRGEADPLDPRNEKYVSLLRKHYLETTASNHDGSGRATAGDYLEGAGGIFLPLAPTLNTRHQLLQRRWQVASRERCAEGEVDTKLVDKLVPLDDTACKRLLRDLTKEVEAGQVAAARDAALGSANVSGGGAEGAVTHRRWQQRLRNVKLMHQSKRRVPDHEKLAACLILPPLPTLRGVLRYIVDSLSPHSNLNPKRDERQDVSEIDRVQLLQKPGGSHILVHVMKAANLPVRNDGTELEPVVEVRFVSFSSSGRTEQGNQPSWFESLKVRFDPPDYDEDTLALIDDQIVVSVYDRLRVELPPAAVTVGANPEIVHYRVEKRLLGSVKIPFYTLYTTPHASLEGMYSLDTPRWAMGYSMPPSDSPSTIQLYTALNPPLRRPKQRQLFHIGDLTTLPVSAELHHVHLIALQWREQAEYRMSLIVAENPLASWRSVDPFVPNVVGDATMMCRYLRPDGNAPPPTVTSVPMAIRFVALQRFEVDMVTWGDRDVWSTNAEFLAKGCGDYEELALLLLHLMRYLAPRERTYLCLGKGDKYHQAAFVLHSVQNTWKLIDPRTGEVCDVHNPHCSLTEVSMVASHDQMWANVQLSGTPYRMMWDLDDQRYWMPLFAQPLPPHLYAALMEPIQRQHLTYPPIEPSNMAQVMEDNLKKAVKKALKSWRNDRLPTYQERVGTILREVLEEVDRERRECGNYKQVFVDEAHRRALAEFEGEYLAVGNPVPGFYERDDPEFSRLLEDVRETAVHSIGTDAVRYGLATYAYAFTGETVALWVYLVALVPRNRER